MTDQNRPDPADTSDDVLVPVRLPDGTLLGTVQLHRQDWERIQAEADEQGVDPGEIIHQAIKAVDRMLRLKEEGRQVGPRAQAAWEKAQEQARLHQEQVYRERRAQGLPVEEWERRPGRDD